MEESFVDLLHSLTNDAKPDGGVRLAELSDLDAEHREAFADAWDRLPSDRRQTLLEELGLMADAQIELNFEAINRIGLGDSMPAVRLQAIENLWESEDHSLAKKFLSILEDDQASNVRAGAGKALGVFVLIGETRQLEPTTMQAIEEALLLAAASDSDANVRNLCLQSLGYSSRPEVPGLIRDAVSDPEEARQVSALRAIGRSSNPGWGELVLDRLHNPSPHVRVEAVRAAGDIDLRESVRDLIELIDDVDGGVRRAAVWSLSQIGGAKATDTLNSMADESDLDENDADLLRDAIDNLAFVEGARELFADSRDGTQEMNA